MEAAGNRTRETGIEPAKGSPGKPAIHGMSRLSLEPEEATRSLFRVLDRSVRTGRSSLVVTRFRLMLVAVLVVGGVAVTGSLATRSTLTSCISGGAQEVLPAGVYATRCFLPGMKITLPPGGWTGTEDTAGELELIPPNGTNTESPALRAFIDPHASTPCTDKILATDISRPALIIKWLKANKNLVIKGPRRTSIAGHIPAWFVDLDTSPSAPRCDPSCPGPCLDYFLFRTPGIGTDPYGTGRGELTRLYFAEIGVPKHLFVFNVDTPNKNVFATMTAIAAKMVAGMHLPSKLPSRQGR